MYLMHIFLFLAFCKLPTEKSSCLDTFHLRTYNEHIKKLIGREVANTSEKHAEIVYSKLTALGICFEKAVHEPAYTMSDLVHVELALKAPFCKNLFLSNRQNTEFFLLLIEKSKSFKTAAISKLLGRSRLSFGPEDKLSQLLGVTPGAISPMGLLFDAEKEINLIIDRDLLTLERICVHPCINTSSIVMPAGDLWNVFIPNCGHTPVYIDIPGDI